MKNKLNKFLFLLSILMFQNLLYSQCKPDYDKKDKTTKSENKSWYCKVFVENRFGIENKKDLEWYCDIQYARLANQNWLIFSLMKDVKMANAGFESQYTPVKGKNVVLAFSNGQKITFKSDFVKNESKYSGANEFKTNIGIYVALDKNKILQLKKSFDSSNIDALDISLNDNNGIQRGIKDGKSENTEEKFNCFFEYIDKNNLYAMSEQDLNDLPPNPNVPESLPINQETNKVSFTLVENIENTPKDVLYKRAKNWITNYSKDDKFSIDNIEEGKICKTITSKMTYNVGNGKKESDINHYYLTILIKDNKFKVELTDIIEQGSTGEKITLEDNLLKLISMPKTTKYVNQLIFEDADRLLQSIKKGMSSQVKTSSDW